MSALTQGWVGVWPTLTMIGAFAAAPGGILLILGVIAGLVGNTRLEAPMVYTGAVLTFSGLAAIIVGIGGWWPILIGGALVAYGFAVRPRKAGVHRG